MLPTSALVQTVSYLPVLSLSLRGHLPKTAALLFCFVCYCFFAELNLGFSSTLHPLPGIYRTNHYDPFKQDFSLPANRSSLRVSLYDRGMHVHDGKQRESGFFSGSIVTR